jgi:translation initiation factor IF-3
MGFEVAKKFIDALGEEVTVEAQPKLEGNKLTCRVAAKP